MIPWRLITKVEAPVHDGLNERHADNGSLYI
ncbi:hypothetical protein ID866_6585 [Astraeus odoratus]|nr:hypothetical protein ID866_6585 [Astraeus odoratus]